MESQDPRKFIICKFLKEPLPRSSWGREMKLAKELLSKYPIAFWEDFEIDFLLESLSFFKGEKGKRILNDTPKPQKIEVVNRS